MRGRRCASQRLPLRGRGERARRRSNDRCAYRCGHDGSLGSLATLAVGLGRVVRVDAEAAGDPSDDGAHEDKAHDRSCLVRIPVLPPEARPRVHAQGDLSQLLRTRTLWRKGAVAEYGDTRATGARRMYRGL